MEIFRPKLKNKHSSKLEYRKKELRDKICKYARDGYVCGFEAVYFFIKTCEYSDKPLKLCVDHLECRNYIHQETNQRKKRPLVDDDEAMKIVEERIKKGGCGCTG